MTGPWSFDPGDEPGVLVAGHDVPGVTGRPWHPAWAAALLEEAGLEPVVDQPMWRLPTDHRDQRPLPRSGAADDDLPGQAGPYADRRIVLEGIAAVPDLADALRVERASARPGAWPGERAGGTWDTCTVVRCTERPGGRGARAAAGPPGRAGYRSVIAPWSPDPDAPPETVHRTYRRSW